MYEPLCKPLRKADIQLSALLTQPAFVYIANESRAGVVYWLVSLTFAVVEPRSKRLCLLANSGLQVDAGGDDGPEKSPQMLTLGKYKYAPVIELAQVRVTFEYPQPVLVLFGDA